MTNKIESIEELAKEFQDTEPDVKMSSYRVEDWMAFVAFWILCAVVFIQFFTRYALNNSASWTEEIARYLLIFVVFLGSAMCVRLDRHIQVDFLYRYLPKAIGRLLATLIDIAKIGFFAYSIWLTWQVMDKVGSQPMTMVDWPMSLIYGVVLIGFVYMTYRSIVGAYKNFKQGSSSLENPETVSGF